MTNYTPIECGLHSEYELAIMHRDVLQLRWQDEQQQTHTDSLTPIDLTVKSSCWQSARMAANIAFDWTAFSDYRPRLHEPCGATDNTFIWMTYTTLNACCARASR